MRSAWLGPLALVCLVACGGEDGGGRDAGGDADGDTDTDSDADVPEVVSLAPEDDVDAFPDTSVVVMFSVPMDVDSVEDAVVLTDGEGTPVEMDLVEEDGATFTFQPLGPLAEDTDHTVRVAESAASVEGTPLASDDSATFHVTWCEEWTLAMPAGPTLANDGLVVGLSLVPHGCTESHSYYTKPILDGTELDAWFLLVAGEPYDEPLRRSEAEAGADLYVNLFCVEDTELLTGERELRVEVTRWIPGGTPDPLVGEATSTLDLSRGEVRHWRSEETGIYDLPWDPLDRASVAAEPYDDGTPVAEDVAIERTVPATVYDPDGIPLDRDFPYMVSLPAGYDADDDSDGALHGLVFAFQGWGPPYTQTSGFDDFIALARSRGYFVVHPQGAWYWDPQSADLQFRADPNQRGTFGCHVGYADYQMRISDPLGFGLEAAGDPPDHNNHNWYSPAFQAIAEDVVRTFTFDPRRVHAVGFSCGAAYAMVLGTWYPDRFATVVPDDPNPSPLTFLDEFRHLPPMVGQPRKTRYFLLGGDDSVGPLVTRVWQPLMEDFFCWEGEARTFAGGHRWHLNEVEADVMAFIEEHPIDPAEVR